MVRHPFLFVADAPPLDFLNTEAVLDGRPADRIADADHLLAWIGESGVASKSEIRALRRSACSTREKWLHAALRLRKRLRAMFSRIASGRAPRRADLLLINQALSSTAGTLRLRRERSRPSVAFHPREITPAFLIARSTAEFLSTADLTLVRRCQGAGCILFFYDTTKSHTRRWCSMATCGNRAKVKAHYDRNRTAD